MSLVHRWLAFAIVAALLGLALWGLAARLRRVERASPRFWVVVHLVENVLVAQIVVGVVLLVIGRRQPFLHYLYGSLFPVIAIVAGRIGALRRERFDYVPVAWAAFVSFGLTTRALMLGMGWLV